MSKKIEIIVDVVSGNVTSKIKKPLSEIEREVAASQKKVEQAHKNTDRAIAESQKVFTREAINQEKIRERSYKNYLRSIENASKETSRRMRSAFSDVFAGTFLGTSAATAVSAGLSRAFSGLSTAFQKSLDFSQMKTSLAQFEGSMSGAEKRIQTLMQVAQQTPGLGFLSAIDGQKRLMAIGFAGDEATKILTGLAKVRVLSGSTKEDFDAMLVNLVQIASGGQKVTQEIREMATRMPALVKIIKDEFGGIGQELNDIDPKVFVARLADAMAKTQADANSTGLAVENLQDSFDRLYIAIGSIIEQNPEVVAAIVTFTKEIDGNTNALADNESATRQNASGWVSWAARASISVANFTDEAQADISAVMHGLAALALGAAAGIMTALSVVPKAINKFVIEPYNAVANLLRGSGLGAIPGMGGMSSMPEASLLPTGDDTIKQLMRGAELSLRGFDNSAAKQRSVNRIKQYNDLLEEQKWKYGWTSVNGVAVPNSRPKSDDKGTQNPSRQPLSPTGGTNGSRGGRISKEDFQLSPQGWALVEAAERLGISPVDLATIISYETRGTFSTGIKGGKGGNYQGLIQFGSEERARYGVSGKQSFEQQLLNSVVPFLQDRFRGAGESTYGASILDLYKTINGGNPNVSGNLSDGNNTIAGHVRSMLRTHQPKVLDRFFGGGRGNVSGLPDDVARALAGYNPNAPAMLRGDFSKRGQWRFGSPMELDALGNIATYGELGKDSKGERAGVSSDLDLTKYEKQIQLNEELAGTYEMLTRAIAGLNEMTEEESFLLDVKLGKFKHLNDVQVKEVAATYRMIDAARKKKKADEEMTKAAEDFANEQQRMFEETSQGFSDLLTDLAEGNFKSIWDRMRRQMLDMFIRPASQYLAQLFSGQGIGGLQPAFGGQGGGILGGLFGGGGMGPGGTPNFNPNSGGGGIGSIFGNLFGGGGSNMGTSGGQGGFNLGSLFRRGGGSNLGASIPGTNMTMPNLMPRGGGGFGGFLRGMGGGSRLAGAAGLGGMAASMIGGVVGGKWGNFLSMTGTGVAIGAQFGGPWGALIGGAIGAAAGLISMLFGRDNAEKKLKEAALLTYGITIKDKSVLKTLKRLGETMFGKGKVGANAQQVVSSDEGQLILRNYAEATNQSGSKIDRLYIGDENWKGNQFNSQFGGFRAFGGSVKAGMSYVVGERGPEMFTAKQSGTITPNGGVSDEVGKRILAVLGGLEETVHQWKEQLVSMNPGDVVGIGSRQNPDAISSAMDFNLTTDFRGGERLLKGAGIY